MACNSAAQLQHPQYLLFVRVERVFFGLARGSSTILWTLRVSLDATRSVLRATKYWQNAFSDDERVSIALLV